MKLFMQYIVSKEELTKMVNEEVSKIIDSGKLDAIYDKGFADGVNKAAQWIFDHLTTEYQGAVLRIVAKEKGMMPVEFVEKFKKAMEE
jgi:hypothetical protein